MQWGFMLEDISIDCAGPDFSQPTAALCQLWSASDPYCLRRRGPRRGMILQLFWCKAIGMLTLSLLMYILSLECWLGCSSNLHKGRYEPAHKLCHGLQGLLPDGLHPNAAGMELIAECLEETLAPLLGRAFNGTAPRSFSREYNSKIAELPC